MILGQVKEEKTPGLKDIVMRDTRFFQESLKWVRKQRQEMEEDLADLKMKQKKIKEVEMVRDNNKILRG